MLCMLSKQRTKFHPSSNFSETYTSNTPKCNKQWNATRTYSYSWRKYNQLYKKHKTSTNWQTFKKNIITSCGDENLMRGSKHIDPALCIYKGTYLICIYNKHLTDKVPQGNGTICQVLNFKLKQNAQSYKSKNYYGKKVWTVSATDVEWI